MYCDNKHYNKNMNIRDLSSLMVTTLLIFFVVTTSGYALSIGEGSLFYYYLIVPAVLLFLRTLASRKKLLRINVYSFSYIGLLFLVVLSFVLNFSIDSIAFNIKFLITVSFAYFFSKYVRFEKFVNYFILVMKFIVITSLIVYVAVNFLKYQLRLPVFTNINGVRYYNGIIFFVFDGYVQARNTGCFWEPGIFASFITLAMIFEICFKYKINKFNIFLFLLGLLSTQSTAGYIMIIFIILCILSKKVKGTKAIIGFLFILLISIIVYFNIYNIVLLLATINPRVFSKLLNNTDSLTFRTNSPLVNLQIFMNFPMFGAGLGNADIIYSNLSDISQTSTSTYFMAAFGIFGILYSFLWIYGFMKFKRINIITRFTALIMVLLIVNKEPHTFFTATYIILFYLLKNSVKSETITMLIPNEGDGNNLCNRKI